VTLIQRFGSAANLNIHLHCLVLDGVYRSGIDGTPEFVEVPEPTDETLQSVLHKIITRMMKLLTRRGVLVEDKGSIYMADNDGDSDEARTLRPLQAAACTYRTAFGPRAGQKVLTVQGVMPRDADFKQTLCADINGFSLHAAVRCGADDRQALE
jgi:Putative transposase